MPLYDLECAACNLIEERLVRRSDPEPVCACGTPMTRLIAAPAAVAPELTPYYDNGLGRMIHTRQERREHMQRYGLVEADKGNTPKHGAKGTIFSFAGEATRSVPKSGAYANTAPAGVRP